MYTGMAFPCESYKCGFGFGAAAATANKAARATFREKWKNFV